MDKKSEIARRTGRTASTAAPAATAQATAAAPRLAAAQPPTGWWMYHGDAAHTGFVSDSGLNSTNIRSTGGTSAFQALSTLSLEGPVLSVPAVANGFIYVGLANYQKAQGGNGGALHKIDIQKGAIVQTFAWDLGCDTRDVHSFTGMGSTPAVVNGRVYFGAFNGRFYCLDEATLSQVWVTDLRNADSTHNQPITNIAGVDAGAPAAVIWSSPVVNADGTKLYVGCGEGENPQLFSFVFCLDTATGNVNWIYCTNQFDKNQPNQPNVLPEAAVSGSILSAQYSKTSATPISMGCSVWGAIAYDQDLNRIYCPTGNQQPEPNDEWSWVDASGNAVTDYTNPPTQPPPFNPELPSPGYSNGVLSLDADTGTFQAFFQVPFESNYRPSDTDIDVGGAPMLFQWKAGQPDARKAVGLGCKNGSFFVLDADTLTLLARRQLLPLHKDGTQIETVDRHPNPADPNLNPSVPNAISNAVPNENFSGVFNTPALYPGSSDNPQSISQRIFLGIGGPNYHAQSPGIDYENTPFMRAIDAATLADAWPLDNGDPPRYVKGSFVDPSISAKVGMYSAAGESGLGSPAVVNDVVFCATSKISLYAFDVRDGTLLWYDDMGMQTRGYNGGYGYCLGPAIWKNYVVAGALVFGREGGGVLKIYGLATQSGSKASSTTAQP
ncbi:putative pyrroloquinoline-quinone-binding quinoprotein [Archangium gephyra]|uniref:Pyrroloquinoline-quinone-binding quinoprotein n=1 Tax=Archangium gephyra TaxID=48 RepID=A0AAC8TJ04_9BACT|nr:PQQ-binding-like beta-propeller repeat protein [Archangium gephyra]AKJ06151.1 Quino(hemo)protein alcohol dehydrogenase, PQQ-dependent [Archangium gephyra]REG27096.1 putative pyrroloquinoline-quinone-binding quinoprotein [Archangium gephyra]